MLVADVISLAQRSAGILGVGQTALAQDLTDATNLLILMMQQWRQKRWLVFRLDNVTFPVTPNKASYTVGPASPAYAPVPPASPPDVVVTGNYRPANIQSCYLRQTVGSGPNSYPIDFPMRIMRSREEYDGILLKSLGSWPSVIYMDPTVPYATLYIWPVPVQNFFELYIGFQQAIDLSVEAQTTLDFDTVLPSESQLAIMWNLALQLCVAYKLPPDQQLAAAARATLNVLRQTNYAMQPLVMPQALRWRSARVKNPMGGFYPETSVGIPYTVLS